MSIPYFTPDNLVSTVRYRNPRSVPGDKFKYWREAGDKLKMFNTKALVKDTPHIAICEGEIDAITACQSGVPAVGIAGVKGWKPLWRRAFVGYDTVFILTDADDKGQGSEFGDALSAMLPNSRTIPMPEGHDVNSFVSSGGNLLERIGIK